MKAIMISIKPKWVAKILNGEKKVEVRKRTTLYKAITKIIEEYGYAEFYVYCTKGKPNLWLPYEHDCFELDEASQPYLSDKPIIDIDNKMNGKVILKFRCYKVEEIIFGRTLYNDLGFFTCDVFSFDLYKQSCLSKEKMHDYLKIKSKGLSGYAIHISDLEIFDKPKELSEFRKCQLLWNCVPHNCQECPALVRLTKAPQSWCYVEE